MNDKPDTSKGSVTRARILEVARDLFTEKGYEKISLREIAEEVGITKAALYYYFPTKEKLFGALVEPLFQMQRAGMGLFEGPADPAVWVQKLSSFLDWILDQRPLFALMQSNQASLHELMHQEGYMDEHIAMHEQMHDAFGNESVPLAKRVRLAGAIMMIIGIVAFPHEGPFAELPVDELRPLIVDAIRDLLMPLQAEA
jgi:AcrR family transcriptional regulator